MKQFLNLVQQQRMEQSLTPQMIQSLKILQISLLDLQLMVREEMNQNPTLERETPEIEEITDFEETARDELLEKREMDELSDLASWDEDSLGNREAHSPADEDRHQFMMDSLSKVESLQEHLNQQLSMARLDDHEYAIAEVIIGSMDDDGYLQLDLEHLKESSPSFPEELFERTLAVIQGFDPPGIGARSLEECLLLQLQHQGKSDSLEATLLQNHLDDLANHRYEKMASALRLSLEEIREISESIAHLDPKPGRNITTERTEYILPEITVEKRDGVWVVIQNKMPYPRLFISPKYIQLLQDKSTPAETRKYIREKIAKSKFFIRSIDQRQETIYRIATEIVRVQEGFLENGIAGLKPLSMKQVADALELHETTISRACNGKYVATPRGTFEFKYFFATGVAQVNGNVLSNASIQHALSEIIRNEDKKRPLSDQKIVEKLNQQGIHIARRTVVKYRKNLKILPTRLRRQT